MRERVAVDGKQDTGHSCASSAAIASIARSVAVRAASAGVELAEVGEVDRRSVADAPGLQRAQAVGSLDAGRHERHAGLERDPGSAGMRLAPATACGSPSSAGALGEHRDHVPLAREPHGRLDRGEVGSPAMHLEAAARPDDDPEREPEQLRLGHEPQKAMWPQCQSERPRVEVRRVAGREDISARQRQILLSVSPIPEAEAHDRPRNGGDQGVQRRGPGRTRHRRRVSRIRRRSS